MLCRGPPVLELFVDEIHSRVTFIFKFIFPRDKNINKIQYSWKETRTRYENTEQNSLVGLLSSNIVFYEEALFCQDDG